MQTEDDVIGMGFDPESVDALIILRAARIELGRHLLSAREAGDAAAVATAQRRLNIVARLARHICPAPTLFDASPADPTPPAPPTVPQGAAK